MTQHDIEEFARLLEHAGYYQAVRLIIDDLLPLARKTKISLYAAAEKYANCDEEQDTTWYQLHMALLNIKKKDLEELDIHKPFREIKIKKKRTRR